MSFPNIVRVNNFYFNLDQLLAIEMKEVKSDQTQLTFSLQIEKPGKVAVIFIFKGRRDPYTVYVNNMQEAHNAVSAMLQGARQTSLHHVMSQQSQQPQQPSPTQQNNTLFPTQNKTLFTF